VNVADGKTLPLPTPPERGLSIEDVSPDGEVAVSDAGNGRVLVWSLGDGKALGTVLGPRRRLISGAHDTTALVWDMTTVPAATVQETKRTAKELETLWQRLSGDAETADASMRELVTCPSQAADLVGRALKPVEKAQAERIAGWVRDLDSEDFQTRQRASAALAEIGEEAEAALRLALEKDPSAETRRRAEELLASLKGPSPQRLRVLRAVQLLEWLGTPEARRVLEGLAAGAPEAERTRVAASALMRLGKR
jgi:hypothetical protein